VGCFFLYPYFRYAPHSSKENNLNTLYLKIIKRFNMKETYFQVCKPSRWTSIHFCTSIHTNCAPPLSEDTLPLSDGCNNVHIHWSEVRLINDVSRVWHVSEHRHSLYDTYQSNVQFERHFFVFNMILTWLQHNVNNHKFIDFLKKPINL